MDGFYVPSSCGLIYRSLFRDLPGIIEGAADGRGRGKQVIATARTCNLILIVLDSGKPITHKKIIEYELNSFGIRINQKVRSGSARCGMFSCFAFAQPPEVKFIKKESGGIGYQEMVKQTKGMSAEACRLVCKEFRVSCAEVILREDITVDQVRTNVNEWYCPRLSRFV